MWKFPRGVLEHEPHNTPDIGRPAFFPHHRVPRAPYNAWPRHRQVEVMLHVLLGNSGILSDGGRGPKIKVYGSIVALEVMIRGIGGSPTVAGPGNIVRDPLRSLSEWRPEPGLGQSRRLGLGDIEKKRCESPGMGVRG